MHDPKWEIDRLWWKMKPGDNEDNMIVCAGLAVIYTERKNATLFREARTLSWVPLKSMKKQQNTGLLLMLRRQRSPWQLSSGESHAAMAKSFSCQTWDCISKFTFVHYHLLYRVVPVWNAYDNQRELHFLKSLGFLILSWAREIWAETGPAGHACTTGKDLAEPALFSIKYAYLWFKKEKPKLTHKQNFHFSEIMIWSLVITVCL